MNPDSMTSEKSKEQRLLMVESQLVRRGISDNKVLKAIKTVPRDKFVKLPYRFQAYYDGPLPIGHGQTISQPYITAFMTEFLKVSSDHTVLEIGTGCGYQTAILSILCKKVISLEIHKSLAISAQNRLKKYGYLNTEVHCSDGKLGWKKGAPYTKIIVSACAQKIPKYLIEQLDNNGTMVIPIAKDMSYQVLTIIKKNNKGSIKIYESLPVKFVPLV